VNDPGKNRSEYERRVNRVIDHIQAHRAENLSLESLAEVAAFSPFHFHRVWKAMTGETVSEFVQRIRLEAAASALLLRPQTDILSIALDNGFNSASAFARAFKERFGMSASQWRTGGFSRWRKPGQADGNLGQADGKPCKADEGPGSHAASTSSHDASINLEEPMKTTVEIQTLPAHRIAYFRNVGPYGAGGGIPETWLRLLQWAQARDLWTGDRLCIGIAHDDPGVTEAAKCRYDASIVIPADFSATDGANVATISGGKVALSRFVGTASTINKAWHDLFSWLPQSGFQPSDRPSLEFYRGDAWDLTTGVVTCDLALPVKPL
jgi:AraC family transcriptional regulator